MTYPGDVLTLPIVVTQYNRRIDPDSLVVTLTTPDAGASVMFTYGEDAELIRDEIGEYHLLYTIADIGESSALGTWSFVWTWEIDDASSSINGTFLVSQAKVAVTLRSVDDTDPPEGVSDVTIAVFRSTGEFVASVVSSLTGHSAFSLDVGEYVVIAEKRGWRFTTTALTVTGDTEETVAGQDLQIVETLNVSLCRVYGYFINQHGKPINTSIFVSSVGRNSRALIPGGAPGVLQRNVAVVTGQVQLKPDADNGYWETELVVGALVRIEVPEAGMNKTFRVPNQSSINFVDVRTDPAMSEREGDVGNNPQLR